ncbi:shikimate kinase [Desulfotalea psychrophila]|uniref:Shikimate kinase n=1 Tax=Desulfotalea psychrophila (strain LSv54 / DSM 12343) TaxID=177439 RepID=Q6AK98_DESPS|nr:shikimate kinase [Desulfotalea psychrophila]CAG37228.1 related to shikimate kinase [Desulfotalea psychrophila LSv54]
MIQKKSNIILIGMPGSGKSTVGVILAKTLGMEFVDTDILIQSAENRTLQTIVDNEGHIVLREIEERVLLTVDHKKHIVATGGSAAYSEAAMLHLKEDGIIVFLHADLAALCARIHNYETRGIAKRPEQSFDDLFAERLALYKKYADITILSSEISQDDVVETVIREVEKYDFRAEKS